MNGTGQYPILVTRKPKKGDFRELKSKHLPGKHAPGPPRSLRLRRSLGNRSVFILDPRLTIVKLTWFFIHCIDSYGTWWKNYNKIKDYNINAARIRKLTNKTNKHWKSQSLTLRADKCWAVKRALRSSFNVWCGVGLARALFPRYRWNWAWYKLLQICARYGQILAVTLIGC